eukprot:TRINITY_DN3462_c2_g1_i1.p1 TRINITY_DN3462_c2_g1~~TRINITY_DN3462_c2_g1_i1.p1  ORF type:complete len:321 (+),score=106.69 TRINITY_DN3462_c2_g1_i1:141-1103(+)
MQASSHPLSLFCAPPPATYPSCPPPFASPCNPPSTRLSPSTHPAMIASEYLPFLGGLSETLQFGAAILLAHEVPFWGFALFEWVCTRYGLLQRYRLSYGKAPSAELVRRSYHHAVFSHFVVQWLALYLFAHVAVDRLQWRPLSADLPPLLSCVLHLVVYAVMGDALNYWIHRMFHLPSLYRFHKQHHEYKSPIPVSSEYFGALEELGTGVVPTIAGPLLMSLLAGPTSVHQLVVVLWVAVRVSESADAHLGYDLPWSVFRLGRPGDRHYYHHSHNVGNYGALFEFWDRVCGTDSAYRQFHERRAQKIADAVLLTKKDVGR